MAVSRTTKLRWFDQGAAAFAQLFPESLAQSGAPPPPLYVCPLCAEPDETGKNFRVQLFQRSAVAAGLLTAEHVLPESFDGKELLLTCAPCNHTAGAKLDAHARRRENPSEAFAGRTRKPVRVRLAAGGHNIAASFSKEGETFKLKVLPEKKGGKPGSEERFRDVLGGPEDSNRDVTISFHADRHAAHHARVSWLRSAYLVMFAVLGYRYIFSPGLAIVRRQIREPETEHIPTFLCDLPGDHPWSEKLILRVREPKWQQGWAVKIGRYMTLLPKPGDTSFYDRIAEERRKGVGQATVHGDAFEWPDRPFFGIG